MGKRIDGIDKAYFEKPHWAGLQIKPIYTPEDLKSDRFDELGYPGYPLQPVYTHKGLKGTGGECTEVDSGGGGANQSDSEDGNGDSGGGGDGDDDPEPPHGDGWNPPHYVTIINNSIPSNKFNIWQEVIKILLTFSASYFLAWLLLHTGMKCP